MDSNITTEQLRLLHDSMALIEPVADSDFDQLAAIVQLQKFSKGEIISKEGDISRSIYFLLSGCVRSFSMEDGIEVNLKFYFETNAFTDFSSMRHEKPSLFYFVAMEDCVALAAMKVNFFPVVQHSKSLLKFSFRFFQHLFFKEQEHSNSFKLMGPEERYLFLEQYEPHYLQRIPVTYLYSYLGTSRETLNRIRRKKV